MADIKVYRLVGIGPTSKYEAIESESVLLEPGVNSYQAYGQSFAPTAVFRLDVSKSVTFNRTQAFVAAVAKETSLGLHYKSYADDGGEGTDVISVTADAIMVPLTVSASKGQVARTSMRAIFMAAPTVGSTAATPVATANVFRIGASTFNGSALDGIEEQSLDFGLDVQTNAGQSGNIYPTVYWVARSAPVATIRTTDLDVVQSYIAGASLSSNACVLKFQNQTGAAGYQYTIAKAYVEGSIRGGMGTLTIRALNNSPIMAGATY